MGNIFRTERSTNFKLSTQMDNEGLYQLLASWPLRSKGQVYQVTWHDRKVSAYKSRTKRPRNTKIGRTKAHLMCNKVHQFQGQRSRSPGWLILRPIMCHNFETDEARNFKRGTQTEHEDQHQRQTPDYKTSVKIWIKIKNLNFND